MKKLISLIFILMLCSMCFCKEIYSSYLGNIDTDSVAKYQVKTHAIVSCQDFSKGRTEYDFKHISNENLSAYFISKECMNDVSTKFSVSNGDLYESVLRLTDNIIVLVYLFKTHESPLTWRYYCYTITFPEEK